MQRLFKRAISGLSAAALLAFSAPVVFAEEGTKTHDLELAINLNLEEELPLTFDKNTDVFYFNANINPGDKMHTSVRVTNNADDALVWTLSDVQNQLTDDEQAIMLLDVLNIKVAIGDEVFYEGTCKDLGGEVIAWRELKSGESEIVDIDWEFDKYADNTYQAANYREKWIFRTQTDIPPEVPDDSEPPEEEEIPELPPTSFKTPTEQGENVQTGVEEEKEPNYALYFVAGGVVIAGGYIVYEVCKRRKNK